HPRNYGCFPRVLGDFVRKKKLVRLEEAVRKMTSLPAARFGLEKRGLLKPGWRADLTIFGPQTVADRATFEQPRQYPAGIAYVLVARAADALSTQRVKLGPCVSDPFTRIPAMLAVAIASLDELSGGRAVLTLGAGGSGFTQMHLERKHVNEALREAILMIRAL